MADLISVVIETQNQSLARALEKIVLSVEGFRVQKPGGQEKAGLLICDIGDDVDRDIDHVQTLMNLGRAGEVFLTSENPEPSVLMRAIRIGAKEFFSQPLNPEEVREGLERVKKRLNAAAVRRHGEVYTVVGSKGGVGTTTVAVNLAAALRQLRHAGTVALVDMNFLFGEIPLFLNFKPQYTWAEIARNISRLDESFLADILFEHASGVHVLPAPNLLNSEEASTPQTFLRILSFMRRMYDYVIIDGGHSLNEFTMKTLEISNRVFMVSLLSLPCLSNTTKLLRSFESWGYPPRNRTDIIINRHIKDSEITIADAEKSIGKPVFWKIPNDYALTMSAINQGKPLGDIDQKAHVTRNFTELALALAPGDVAHKQEERDFFKKLRLLKPMMKGA